MGTVLQWRKFNFFYTRTVVDSSHFSELISSSEITCTGSGKGIIYIGDSEGYVHSINRQLQISNFNADNSPIKRIFACDNTNLLITIKDNFEGLSTLKVWSLDRFSSQNPPSCVRTIHPDPRVYQESSSKDAVPMITAISFCSNIFLLAVGFSNGAIIMYKDVQRERGCKANNLAVNITSPITNLHIRYTQKKTTHLFVTTSKNIYCINVLAKSKEVPLKLELDNWGCNVGCSTLSDSKHEHELLVARDDAIYAYTTDSRTSCFIFEGEKKSVSWFRGYLVVVAKEEIGSRDRHVMTIYDPVNKLVALSTTIEQFVSIVSEWGGLYVVTSTPSVLHLSEIDLQSKLDLLFKKNQFDIAISIAKMQYCDQEEVCEILKQYGDWLYGKGNSVAAMEQYIKTIPYLEPSYVIKKFLDTQHIENLTIYLQALHKSGHATSDHTTLMLNCYTRLRDSKQLDNFILDKEIECDVDVAVKVCRGAGYLTHALSLCLKHNLHDLYLSILINDTNDYDAAIQYILKLPRSQVKECILQYGTSLLKHRPTELIDIIVDICANYDKSSDFGLENPEDFEHLLIGQSEATISLLEKVMHVRPLSSHLNTFLLSELLHQYSLAPEGQDQTIIGDKILKLLRNVEVKYDRDHTLLLCDKHNFSSGKLVIWEQTGLFEDLLQWHADNGDYASAVDVCKHHGEDNQQLWVLALRLITQETIETPPDINLLNQILKKIDEYELLPPLTIADYITSSPHVTLGQVKHYIQNLISAQTSSLQSEVSQFVKQQDSISHTKQSIASLTSDTIYFTNTKCNVCNNNLELPSIHFLCRHSFHKHCLESYSENDECPRCAPDRKVKFHESSSSQDDKSYSVLQEQLENTSDSFSVLANSIGSGVFAQANQTTLEYQHSRKQEISRKRPPIEILFQEAAASFPAVVPSFRPPNPIASLNEYITTNSTGGASVPPDKDISFFGGPISATPPKDFSTTGKSSATTHKDSIFTKGASATAPKDSIFTKGGSATPPKASTFTKGSSGTAPRDITSTKGASATPPKDISSSVPMLRESMPKIENPFEADRNPFGDDFEDERLPPNPFEEENYDEAKNPFAFQDEDTKKNYDSSLNPFED